MITVTANVVGRVTDEFTLYYTIANTMEGAMNMRAFMDSEANVLYSGAVTNGTGTLTVDAEDNGIHVIYLIVTDINGQSGSTSISFTKVSGDEDIPIGLKMKYDNDVWDFENYPQRLYRQSEIIAGGETLTAFEDVTPYITQGDDVDADLLAAVSQNILEMIPTTVDFALDGTVTERNENGLLTMRRNQNGSTTVMMADSNGVTVFKDIIIGKNGSVQEEVYV